MTEEVFQLHYYPVGHRMDKQLLLVLEEIFKKYSSTYYLNINVECSNSTIYKFDNIDEFVEYFEKSPYRIVKMEIEVTLGERYSSNRIELVFDNKSHPSTEVKYKFNNTDDYLRIKDKIEQCLKNFRLNYSILSRIAIIPFVLTIIFVGICIYTGIKDIVYPKNVQTLIFWTWLGGSFIIAMFPPFVTIKRNLFPCTEFRIGQNNIIEEKNEKTRNFIVGTVVIGTIMGIMVNGISGFLF